MNDPWVRDGEEVYQADLCDTNGVKLGELQRSDRGISFETAYEYGFIQASLLRSVGEACLAAAVRHERVAKRQAALRTVSDEAYAKFPPLTDAAIAEALAEGQEAYQAALQPWAATEEPKRLIRTEFLRAIVERDFKDILHDILITLIDEVDAHRKRADSRREEASLVTRLLEHVQKAEQFMNQAPRMCGTPEMMEAQAQIWLSLRGTLLGHRPERVGSLVRAAREAVALRHGWLGNLMLASNTKTSDACAVVLQEVRDEFDRLLALEKGATP